MSRRESFCESLLVLKAVIQADWHKWSKSTKRFVLSVGLEPSLDTGGEIISGQSAFNRDNSEILASIVHYRVAHRCLACLIWLLAQRMNTKT
jgi:hypothetical protein